MMRDIKDSERIRNGIVKTLKPQVLNSNLSLSLHNLNTCIVSKGYWDSMQADDNATGDGTSGGVYQPPSFLKKVFDDFAAKYQQFKRMRTVNFRPHLGAV